MLEAWTTLTGLAMRTEHLRFGVLVTANTFRPPALLARMAATVDRASGGRLEMGLGMVGAYAEREHLANGLPFPSGRERLAMLQDSCEVLRRLWSEDVADYEGAYWSLDSVACEPKPHGRALPLLIGGTGKGVLDVVARHADRWNVVGSEAMVEAASANLALACETADRDPATVARTARNDFFLARDRAEGEARLLQMASFWGVTPAETKERMWIGDAAEVAEQLAWYEDHGFDELILGLAPPYDGAAIEMLERVAAEVRPHLGGD